jgi:hypothetical protein
MTPLTRVLRLQKWGSSVFPALSAWADARVSRKVFMVYPSGVFLWAWPRGTLDVNRLVLNLGRGRA